MYKILLTLLAIIGAVNSADAETTASHCASNENIVFSCHLTSGKIVSICTTKNTSGDSGYLQFRFGTLGRIEVLIPRTKSGIPELSLAFGKNSYLGYNKVAVLNRPFTYIIESFRQFKKTNKDGYPNTKSSDYLKVTDSRKSAWEGNTVFSNQCSTLDTPIDAKAIAKLTGVQVENAMF